jgi:hypothetical protein
MATTNTGMQRAETLTISKSVGGTLVYEHSYSLLSAFSTYSAITSQDVTEMSVASYTARLEAFKEYVESIEVGLSISTTDAYRENLTSCPI